jgi:hypothetical protein
MEYDVEQIAKTCHEVNRVYCKSVGDFSQAEWHNTPDWQRESAIMGVNAFLKNPILSSKEMHDLWMEHKISEGWVYGEVKDAVKKTHPCLVPYSEMPKEQQMKDEFFIEVIKSFL